MAGGVINTRSPVGCHKGSRTLRIGSLNVGSLSGRSGEVVEMAGRRNLDFCCVQETRWKGGSSKTEGMKGRKYKIIWQGCSKGTAGVGMLVHERWIDSVKEVRRINERILALRVVLGTTVLWVVSVYAPQVGRPVEEKVEFYSTLRKLLAGFRPSEMLVLCGDMNGHVGAAVEGFLNVHGGNGFGSRNLEGEMFLEFAESMNLLVANTWFVKNDRQKITYESGGCSTVVDYVCVRKGDHAAVRDVSVIRKESCVTQHKLLVCVLELDERESIRCKKRVFVGKCKSWRLREEDVQQTFREKIQSRSLVRPTEEGLESMWKGLKDSLLEISEQVCGKTMGPARHAETWWWNTDTECAVREKRRLFIAWDESRLDQDRKAYCRARSFAKKVILKAKEAERVKLAEKLEEEDARGNLFRVAKQMVKKNRDVVGDGCMKGKDGEVVVDDAELMKVWKCYYEKLLNEEFDWDQTSLESVDAVSGPCEYISAEEVGAAIAKSKPGKAAGPSGIVVDMLKASGEVGRQWVADVCNKVVLEGCIPEDWRKSWMVNVYKGKGDSLECGSYRGIKLLDHVMKVLERVIEVRVRSKVSVDGMQFGFCPGKGTIDAIFIVRQMQEKYFAKRKVLWMAFVDLEKAFDRVPRKVLWWALRQVKLEEWIIDVIKAMYAGATTSVKSTNGISEEFEVKVGVHQGSVLSPLLFIIVMEALSSYFRSGLPWEILYADDLVLLAETEEELRTLIARWKSGMEVKGLRVNMEKTKVMRCEVGSGQVLESGNFPCGVCGKGVGRNSIVCTCCRKWIHYKCSGVAGKLVAVDASAYICPKCVKVPKACSSESVTFKVNDTEGLELVDRFCYLGDMLGKGGGAEEASRTRVRCAWGKFNELGPILTMRGASLKLKGKIYRACVQRVLVYGSETWPMLASDIARLERAENAMVRWMCSVTLKDKKRLADLREWLGIECVSEVVKCGRLRWYGHLERKDKDDWVSACRNFEVAGSKNRGRGRKTWSQCVSADMKERGLRSEDAQSRDIWRILTHGDRLTLPQCGRGRMVPYELRSRDVKR